MTIKEYIVQRLHEFDSTLDLSDGSALIDLLVNPGSAVLDPLVSQINFFLENLGLSTPESMNEGELDAIASNFLKARVVGSKATGVVELFYNNPISLDIPQGTTFTSSNGLVFETTQQLHIPLASMAANTWNFPRYSTGTIPVVAKEYGAIGSIAPNEIRSTDLLPAPALVTNPASFAGGSDKESNTDFVARIIDEVITSALGSAAGIKTNLSQDFPTILEIKTRGMNDIEMLRDLVYSGIQVYNNYYDINYYGKISGLNEPPYPESLAYWGVFYDSPATSGMINDLPSIYEVTEQFTTEQYGGIYKINDALKTTIQTLIVFSEDFQSPTLSSSWVSSDSLIGLGKLKDVNECILTTLSGTQMLRLGNRLSVNDVDAQGAVVMTQQQLYNILNFLAAGSVADIPQLWLSKFGLTQKQIETYSDLLDVITATSSVDDNMLSSTERQLWNLIQSLGQLGNVENSYNYYPLVTRSLAKHSGITVTGRFMTDDTTSDGRLSYVTVLRDEDSIDPSNGFGFAWMKNDSTNSIFNVYLVDNSAMANDLFVTPTFIVRPQGENTFRAAAKVDIKADRLYRFKLTIGEDYATDLKIWQDGSAEPGLPQVSAGAPLSVSANGTRVGFGVMGTKNSQWFYDDLLVENNRGVHTTILYRLKADPAQFPNGTYARVNHYGYGYDDSVYGLTAFLKQYNTGTASWEWVEIGSNTSSNVSDRDATRIAYDFLMSNSYRDTDNFIDMLVTSTSADTTVTNVTSYYANLETGIPSGVHTGGCADIYINDPTAIVVAEQTLNNMTGNLILDPSNGFLGPLHSIVEIQTALIGDSLVENEDWVLITNNYATAFSTSEYPYITFTPDLASTKVKVVYRYYAHGSDIQTRLSSDEYRYSGTSNLVKITPPVLVRVNNLKFRGPITVTEVQTAIANYVNAQTYKVIKSEILNAVYAAGATYVDLTDIDIEVIATNYKRETSDPEQLVIEYIKEDLAAFFTDTYEMNGVTKI